MTAFGSHCERNAPAFENSLIIAFSNSAFSVVSGLCVFGILGYLSTIDGDFRVAAGPALLFGAYPAALSTIPGGLWWVRFLFLNLILLGLDSAFALVEAVVTVIEDSSYNVWPRQVLVAVICTVGFLCGLIYTTDAALNFLDVTDFYVNFIILLLAFFKSFSTGWFYGNRKVVDNLGYRVVQAYLGATFGSITLASLVWFGVSDNTVVLGFICLFSVYGAGIYYCWDKMKPLVDADAGRTMRSMSYELAMGNIIELKEELESSVGYIPYAWAVLMKHL